MADRPTAGKDQPKRRIARKRLSRQQQRRRSILRAGIVGVFLLLLHPLLAIVPGLRNLRDRLRPPGALEERAFLGACIKCGQCVQVCPVQAIRLADIGDGLGTGVPYIEARDQACDFSCDALSCILACPTGALSHDLGAKEEVEMGLARLARPESCLARRGKGFRGRARGHGFRGRMRFAKIDRWNPIPLADHEFEAETCDLCVRMCPIGETALRLEPLHPEGRGGGRMTPVVGDACVGCGACEMVCPEEPACIVVEPRAKWSET